MSEGKMVWKGSGRAVEGQRKGNGRNGSWNLPVLVRGTGALIPIPGAIVESS
jgi:hypothetical protein